MWNMEHGTEQNDSLNKNILYFLRLYMCTLFAYLYLSPLFPVQMISVFQQLCCNLRVLTVMLQFTHRMNQSQPVTEALVPSGCAHQSHV